MAKRRRITVSVPQEPDQPSPDSAVAALPQQDVSPTLPWQVPLYDESQGEAQYNPGPELTPKEESSLLGKTMGLVQYAGESLEKPGYAVRGLMAGKGSESLLNLIPFYDTVQNSDIGKSIDLPEAPKVSGEDLTGWTSDEDDPWYEKAGKFTGNVGVEIATNPISFLSPFSKAITPAMEAAKVAEQAGLSAAKIATAGLKVGSKAYKTAFAKAMEGVDEEALRVGKGAVDAIEKGARPAGASTWSTPAEFANQIRAGERGVLGVGFPFMQPSFVLGKGSEKAAKLAEAVGYSLPVRAMRGMFSHVPGVGGVFDPNLQKEADLGFAKMQRLESIVDKADNAYVRGFQPIQDAFTEAADGLRQQGDQRSADEFTTILDDLTRTWKSAKDGPPAATQMADDMTKALGLPAATPGIADIAQSGSKYSDLIESMQNTEDAIHGMARRYGMKIGTVNNPLERYTPRWSDLEEDKFNPGAKRRAVLNIIPQSTKYGNQMVRDAVERGYVRNADGAWEKLDDNAHLSMLINELSNSGVKLPDAPLTLPAAQRLWVTEKYIRPSFDDAVQRGLLSQQDADKSLLEILNPTKVTTKRGNGTIKVSRKSPAINKIVRWINSHDESTLDTGIWNRSTVDEHYAYMKNMINKLYDTRTTYNFLKADGVLQKASGAANVGTPLAKEWENLGLTSNGLKNLLSEVGGSAKDWVVSDNGSRVLKTMSDLRRPQTVTELGNLFNKITNVYKTYWTIPRSSFHARNMAGGTVNSLAEGVVNPLNFFKEWGSTYKQVAAGDLSDELTAEFVRHGGLGQGAINDINDLLKSGSVPQGPLGGAFSTAANAVLHPVKTLKEGGFTPWNVGTESTAPNAAIKAGQQMYSLVEYMNRVPYYKALRKSGMSPQEAMAHVERAQFNYAQKSPLERRVLSKVMPFYGWIRNNLPLQVKRIVEHPIASPTGMMAKGMTELSSDRDNYTPNFLKEGFALPLGGPPNARTFLKAAGLPLEDLNRFVVSGTPTESIRRTAQKFASGLHPGIVGPIEGMTGQQLYSGRPLSELQGGSVGVPSIDKILNSDYGKAALHYSPAASLASDALQWLDPRKGWGQKAVNELTGIKTGTYDAELMRKYELQNALNEEAAKNPLVGVGQYAYVKPKYRGTPDAAEVAAQLKKVRGLSKSIKRIRQKREMEGKTQ